MISLPTARALSACSADRSNGPFRLANGYQVKMRTASLIRCLRRHGTGRATCTPNGKPAGPRGTRSLRYKADFVRLAAGGHSDIGAVKQPDLRPTAISGRSLPPRLSVAGVSISLRGAGWESDY